MKTFLRFISVLLISILMLPFLALAGDDDDGSEEGGETVEEEGEETKGIKETTPQTSYTTEKTNDDGDIITETTFMCTGGGFSAFTIEYEQMDEDADMNEEIALIEKKINEFEKKFSDELSTDSKGNGRCGTEPHPITGSLEMADCADDGKVVTEIGEIFGGDTKLGDGDEAYVVTVYRANCCMIIQKIDENTYECKDHRKLYYTDISTCSGANSWSCERRQWIIGESGASIIKLYIKQIYMWAAGTIGFIAVVTIVLNGIRISVSGVSGDVTQAKERIIQAISGLVLLFLSGLILYTINPTFFG